jgi:hypothetical protein
VGSKRRLAAAGLLALALATPVPAAAVTPGEDEGPPSTRAPARDPADTSSLSERPVIRTAGGEVVLMPTARLQIDAAFFPRQTPKSGAYLRRARVGLAGWLSHLFYFDVAVDMTPLPPEGAGAIAPSALAPADAILAFAPPGDRFILQAGQFDAPFTLENRTSDAYTPFIERSMAARTLGVPRNKEVGVMAHGIVNNVFYYSAGVFNGEGSGFRNLDNQPDAIGRLVLAPFGMRGVAIGGSAWYGRHVLGALFPIQATPGGLQFINPSWTNSQFTLEMREQGPVMAFAGELSVPIGNRFGLRAEGVFKKQDLAEVETSAGTFDIRGDAELQGIAGYGELWVWLVGDGRLLPVPGLQLPVRPERRARFDDRPFDPGLMFVVRGELLKEDVTSNQPTLGNPNRATTRVISGSLGLNYWRGRLVRFSLNYTGNYWSGTSETIKTLAVDGKLEHEVLLRFALSL